MARELRVHYPGAIYHVSVRGNARQRVFLDTRDRERFMENLGSSADIFDTRIYLFCMMGNHFHLLVETPRGNISQFMHSLLTGYTNYFNKKHDRVGHLFQGRFGAKLVSKDEYLLRLSRYIHLNPVHTRAMVSWELEEKIKFLRQYQWSSYRSYIGLSAPHSFMDYGPIFAMTAHGKVSPRDDYREFVENGLRTGAECRTTRNSVSYNRMEKPDTVSDVTFLSSSSRHAIGSPVFLEEIQNRYKDIAQSFAGKEESSFRRCVPSMAPAEVIDRVCRRCGWDHQGQCQTQKDSVSDTVMRRTILAMMLVKHASLTQREAARFLGWNSGTAVCIQLKKLGQSMQTNMEIKAAMDLANKAVSDT